VLGLILVVVDALVGWRWDWIGRASMLVGCVVRVYAHLVCFAVLIFMLIQVHHHRPHTRKSLHLNSPNTNPSIKNRYGIVACASFVAWTPTHSTSAAAAHASGEFLFFCCCCCFFLH
jgi:uncharacterized membrane protein